MENIMVGLIVALALVLCFRRLARILRGERQCGCNCACGPDKKACCDSTRIREQP